MGLCFPIWCWGNIVFIWDPECGVRCLRFVGVCSVMFQGFQGRPLWIAFFGCWVEVGLVYFGGLRWGG